MAKIQTEFGVAFPGAPAMPVELALPFEEVVIGMDVTILQTRHEPVLVDRSLLAAEAPDDVFLPGPEVARRPPFTLPVIGVTKETETLFLRDDKSVLVLPVGVRSVPTDRNTYPNKSLYMHQSGIGEFIVTSLFRPMAL